jgi:hypothetical protein
MGLELQRREHIMTRNDTIKIINYKIKTLLSRLDPTTCYKWDDCKRLSVGYEVFRTSDMSGEQLEIVVQRNYSGNNTLFVINGEEFVVAGYFDVLLEDVDDLEKLYVYNSKQLSDE